MSKTSRPAERLSTRFWGFWAATGASSIGDGMVAVGFPLLALSYTHRAPLIAGVAVAGQLPALFFALPAGALADRLNRRTFLVVVQAFQFLVLGTVVGILAGGGGTLAMVYLAAFFLGTLTVAFDCAASAALPSLVPAHLFVSANSRLAYVDLAGEEMVGQALGGFAYATARAVPFLAGAVGLLASVGLVHRSIPDNDLARPDTTLLSDLLDGMRWFARHRLMRMLTGLVALLAFCQALVFGILVLYCLRVLHTSEAGYGVLLGASAAGNVVGAAFADRLHAKVGTGWCIAAGGLVSALAYPVLAEARSPLEAGLALALESMAISLGIVATQSLRQAVVPQELLGRVGSANLTVVLAARPLGALTGGVLAMVLGIRPTFLLAGCLQLVIVAIATPRLLLRVSQTALVPA